LSDDPRLGDQRRRRSPTIGKRVRDRLLLMRGRALRCYPTVVSCLVGQGPCGGSSRCGGGGIRIWSPSCGRSQQENEPPRLERREGRGTSRRRERVHPRRGQECLSWIVPRTLVLSPHPTPEENPLPHPLRRALSDRPTRHRGE
jgi:hypothetical protein